MNKIIVTLIMLVSSLSMNAQRSDSLLFKNFAVGISIGTTGFGLEAATSINRNIQLRAGIHSFYIGTVNMTLPVTNGDINDYLDIKDPTFTEATSKKKAELGLDIAMFTGSILADYFPRKDKSFHITAGVYLGNKNVLHFFNKNDGELKFLNTANERILLYNELYHTSFRDAGLNFGDYTFTADKNGNIDAELRTWLVRPYLGVGWGRNVSMGKNRRINYNFDAGFQFWGTPKCLLNKEKTINTGKKDESGILQIVSGFSAWPSIRLTVSSDIIRRKAH